MVEVWRPELIEFPAKDECGVRVCNAELMASAVKDTADGSALPLARGGLVGWISPPPPCGGGLAACHPVSKGMTLRAMTLGVGFGSMGLTVYEVNARRPDRYGRPKPGFKARVLKRPGGGRQFGGRLLGWVL